MANSVKGARTTYLNHIGELFRADLTEQNSLSFLVQWLNKFCAKVLRHGGRRLIVGRIAIVVCIVRCDYWTWIRIDADRWPNFELFIDGRKSFFFVFELEKWRLKLPHFHFGARTTCWIVRLVGLLARYIVERYLFLTEVQYAAMCQYFHIQFNGGL